jgi:hypothetical protein
MTSTPAMADAVRRLKQHGGSLPEGAIPELTLKALVDAGLVVVEYGRAKLL